MIEELFWNDGLEDMNVWKGVFNCHRMVKWERPFGHVLVEIQRGCCHCFFLRKPLEQGVRAGNLTIAM